MVIAPEVLLLLRIVFNILFVCFVIPDEFSNYSFQLYEELRWNFDEDCIEYVDCFLQDDHFFVTI